MEYIADSILISVTLLGAVSYRFLNICIFILRHPLSGGNLFLCQGGVREFYNYVWVEASYSCPICLLYYKDETSVFVVESDNYVCRLLESMLATCVLSNTQVELSQLSHLYHFVLTLTESRKDAFKTCTTCYKSIQPFFFCENLVDFNEAHLYEVTLNLHVHAWIFSFLSIASVDGKKHLSEVVFSGLGFSL